MDSTKSGRKPSRQPDVSFVKQERLPERFRSYPELAPDLAVEVVSPTDKYYETASRIEAKIVEYQKAGVKLVWMVHPYSRQVRQVDVYRLEGALRPQICMGGDELEGENVIVDILLYQRDIDLRQSIESFKLAGVGLQYSYVGHRFVIWFRFLDLPSRSRFVQ